MIVLAPFTTEKLDPRTTVLIEQHIPKDVEVRWREIDPDDPTAYSRLLVEMWEWPDDTLIVEHDIGIHAGVVDALTECTQPWCGFPYPIGEQLLICLGCTRFTARLKATLPTLMEQAAAVGDKEDGGFVAAGMWQRMDVRVGCLLEAHGLIRHQHLPAVEHYHTY